MESVLNLFRAAADGACGISRNRRIVMWNRAAEALLGFQARDVLDRPCFEVFGGRDEAGHRVCQRDCPMMRMAETMGVIPTSNLQVHTKTGESAWFSVSTILIPPRWQTRAVLVHLFRDVSRAKACRDAVDHLLDTVTRIHGSEGTVREDGVTPAVGLTPRELEVLELLAVGKSTRDIAASLVVSSSTARNHVHNILTKLDAHSRLEAVVTALQLRLL